MEEPAAQDATDAAPAVTDAAPADTTAMEAVGEAEAAEGVAGSVQESGSLIVRLRGLPYATTPQNVQEFFGDLQVAHDGVWLLGNGAGEAFVTFQAGVSEETALSYHKKYLGERYIEVMKTDALELEARRRMSKADAHGNGEGDTDDLPNYGGVIRMRGLPWTSTEDDIREFFAGCAGLRAGDQGVYLCRHPDGRSRGMAYAVFDAESHAEAALQAKDRQQMGGRYIELFQATKGELNSQRNDASRGGGPPQIPAELPNEGILKIKGLPWTATAEQIRGFFRSHDKPELAGQECLDAVLVVQPDGRSSGEAFALFDSPLTAAKMRDALNGKELDGRWLHLIHTNRAEMVHTIEGGGGNMMGPGVMGGVGGHPYGAPGGSAPYGAAAYGGGGGYGMPQGGRDMSVLRLRGIPWTTTAEDVAAFFTGFSLQPLPHGILVCSNASGRPAGEAYAAFESEAEAQRALVALNREQMGSRYVELFKCSQAEMYQIAEAGGVKGGRPGGMGMGRGGMPPNANAAYGAAAYGAYGQSPYGAPQMGYDQRAASAYDQRARAAYDHRAPAGGPGAGAVYTCCKLRGLPFSATHQDIFQFFSGLNVIGTLFVRDPTGRPTGEAFCEFQTPYEVTLAAQRHRQHMGTRYVEVFPCAKEEVMGYYNQSGGEGAGPQAGAGPGAGGHPQGQASAAPANGAAYAGYGAQPQGGYGAPMGQVPGPGGQGMGSVSQVPQGYEHAYGQGAPAAAQGSYGYYPHQGQAPPSYGAPAQDGMQAGQSGYPHNGY